MKFDSPKGTYEVVGTLLSGKVNSCYVSRMEGQNPNILYTMIGIHEHETVLMLMEILKEWNTDDFSLPNNPDNETVIQDSFSNGNDYILVFPHRTGRPVSDFYVGEAYELEECEEVCFNVLLTCITAGVPYPLLYLLLEQGKLNIARDKSIYLSYDIDLSSLDKTKMERDCATKCADILLELLESKANEKSIVYELLTKKVENKSYSFFTEIYRDLRIATAPEKKMNILKRIKSFFVRNADTLFGILFWVCLFLAIAALLMLISHLVVGDIPFLRLFFNSFKKIGTESLTQ